MLCNHALDVWRLFALYKFNNQSINQSIRSMDYSLNNCIHTALNDTPGQHWWQVDLGRSYTVYRLKIWGRRNCMYNKSKLHSLCTNCMYTNKTRQGLYSYSPSLNSTRIWRVGEWLSAPQCQWRSGSASVPNARRSGLEPRQGQGFSSSYKTPELPSDETINRGSMCVRIQNIKQKGKWNDAPMAAHLRM
jgi:hypothetical protein